MSTKLDGCCSKFYKYILVFLNVVIFIIGLVVTILAALLKYDKNFKDLLNLKELEDVVDVAKINSITILFLTIGIFAIILSLLGLFGLWCLNKFFLIVYEVIVILLFLTHGIGLLVLVFGKTTIVESFEKEMVKIVENLNTYENDTKEYKKSCDTMLALSDLFSCCGDKSPRDFNTTARYDCCNPDKVTNSSVGCTQKTIDDVTDNAFNFLVIPSLAILGVELFVIIFTPFIIGKIRNY